jgi:[acyl-carrier-protein] S-malonyltransferase
LIRDCLVRQITGTVRWRDSIGYMASQGVTIFVEVGAGKVLTGLVKRIVEGVTLVNIGTPPDIAAFSTRT